ncbi:MAG: N-acetylneuraminate synthase [Thaumarchaeota archaeon]|jgi:N-acetylneuraminate synthase|nr:MAG: N-acetylneuraminate synthase [Nitrososphaerota archaeon]
MVFIISEIGINHNGDLGIAKKLIDIASDAGCDAVKFQKRDVEKVYKTNVLDSPRESPWGKTTRDQKLGLEFSLEQYDEIDNYCKSKNIDWYVSCWDVGSQIQMRKFNTKFNKVASAMLLHEKLLRTIAEEEKHTFISTGMSTMEDISNAVNIFKEYDCPIELMHSHSAYPMSVEEANIRMIPALKNKFNCNIGYSGHETSSYLVCVAAVILGATSIERHITLDRTMYGSDQSASLEPEGLKRMIRDIRIMDKILGDGTKKIWDSELPAMKKLREVFA